MAQNKEIKQLVIGGLPIALERKKIKNMYLRILPPEGRVFISAPFRMSEEEIERFVLSKLSWIEVQQEKLKHRHTHQEQEYITGEMLYIWGTPYRIVGREAPGRGMLSVIGEEVILKLKADSTKEERERLVNSWYKKTVAQELPYLFARWENIIGVKANGWNIRNMKTRWGTCNIRTKVICINSQLAKKHPACLEYVVIHELVHLLEKSHNYVFKAYMDRYLPNWRTIKKELNGAE